MEITPAIVRELLHYEASTGVFTWRKRGSFRFNSEQSARSWNSRFAGKRAGRVWTDKRGYRCRRLSLLGVEQYEHRLAWVWMTGYMPPEEIDHSNQDATDNRWVNLLASDRMANQHNKSMQTNNTSGVTGVTRHAKTDKWHARGTLGGARHHLGLFDEIDEAAMAVMEFRAEQGFGRRHGLHRRA